MNRTDNFNPADDPLTEATLASDRGQQPADRPQIAKMLDQVFPLFKGSHTDVASYLVYYDHLLAMFTDGSSTGLKTPSQLLDYSGHKTNPTSIILGCQALSIEVELTPEGAAIRGNTIVH